MNFDMPGIAVANIIFIIAIERFLRIFFETRTTKCFTLILSYLPLAIAMLVLDLLWNHGVLINIFGSTLAALLVVIVLGTFIITLNYESSLIRRMVASCYVFVTRDIAIGLANNFILIHIPRTELLSPQPALLLLGNIAFLVVSIVYSRFRHIKKETIYTPTFWGFALLIAIFMIVVGVVRGFGFPGLTLYYTAIIMFAGSHFAVFYLSNVVAKLHEYNLKAALHAQESEYYFSQCQLMQQSVEQVKAIRHDIKMHLATVRNFTANNSAAEATDYLTGLLGTLTQNEIYSDTGNIAFDSIINFKLNQAKEQNITPDICILIPPAVNIDVADIVTILGNLLDNAIDALARVEDKVLKLDIELSKGSLFIKIDNTFDGVVKYAKQNEGDAEHIATRKDGGEHGRGFKNIVRSIEKYNGHMDIAHEGNMFSVTVILYVDDM